MATKANDLCPESILVEGRELYEATVLEGLNEKPRVGRISFRSVCSDASR